MSNGNKNMFVCLIIVSGLILISVFGIFSNVLAITEKERVSLLIEGAKLEKEVVGIGSPQIEVTSAVVKEFEKKYPFLKVNYTKLKSDAVTTRILMEARGGKFTTDFGIMSKVDRNIFKDQGLLMSYESPEAVAYPEKFKDPDGNWIGASIKPRVIAWNTKLVSPKDAPSSFQDLLDPKWKGEKIGMADNEFEWFSVAKQVWGEQKATSYLKKLAEQKVSMRRGSRSQSTVFLISGEFPIVFQAFLNTVLTEKKGGAPIAYAPGEFSAMEDSGAVIMAKAPHPNAAKLFYDFWLSKRGQEILGEFAFISTRSGFVGPYSIDTDKFNFVLEDPNLVEEIKNKTRKEFMDIMMK